jgi:bifunctional DNase/RNase
MKSEDMIPNTLTHFLFHQPLDENEVITDQELIELSAYGLSVGHEMGQPLLILKALKEDLTLPIPLNPLEAGITLAQSNKSIAPVSPHKATAALLKALSMQIEKCVFVEIKNSHQFVKLFVTGHPQVRSLKVKAEEVLSLCLYLEVPLYTTREFIARSRVMVAEIDEQRKELLNNPGFTSKTHLYMN